MKSKNIKYHIAYWIFVILVLTLVFGRSWGNNLAAFYFVSMLLPIVFGTSYFVNYFLVPKYLIPKKYFQFGTYIFYTIIISLYLELIVLMFSFIYLGNFNFKNLAPNASDTILLGIVLYLLVFVGSFILILNQLKENKVLINQLIEEQKQNKAEFLELISNRKSAKIPLNKIIYIESLADYIQVHIENENPISSKEKISKVAERLPNYFLRIHRSFVVNGNFIKKHSYTEIDIGIKILNVGRTYQNIVKEKLNQ